jgi:hypothetical protein
MENNTTIETAIEKINARFDALGKFLVQPKQYPPLSIMSDAIDQLATATALAKNEWPRITKDSIAHRHRYAKYEDILIATTPILSKQGLTVFQFVERSEYGDLGIRTLITHASGQWIQSFLILPLLAKGPGSIEQQWGVTISYFKRYAYNSALGIIVEDPTDNDGNTDAQSPTYRKTL